MKKLGLFIATLVIGFTGIAQDSKGVTVKVTIENVLSDGGTILGGLHTAETFMKGAGVLNATEPAKAGEVTLTFENVEPGTFAIMVMHDKNDNKQMDMDANGMPQESYGTSGEMNMFGPPNFESSKFEVTDEDQEIRIRF
ncbi:DUF2141 domain-containing protein [Maribacter algarum]|uniref:DUF2141 domain-containing protein n=1 Tax=Maribacter algarum (ex Zhang et al. 2020) TaxID=2578118 RepID=A0A5S3PQ02_9FLAO|nr:DUF2141 domain-containing protein [Maribacter algarum]TMM56820.1 DUF2141 domain-containing protein [Maribacter algarum]